MTLPSRLNAPLLPLPSATVVIFHYMKSCYCNVADELLDVIGQPIREYLCSRPNTIRCIVSMLTADPSGEDDEAAEGLGLGSALLRGGPEGGVAEGAGSGAAAGAFTSEAEGDEAAIKLLEALAEGRG